jgi:hypothetical protein
MFAVLSSPFHVGRLWEFLFLFGLTAAGLLLMRWVK